MTDVVHIIERMAGELQTLFTQRDISKPAFVGIHTGGVWIAEALQQRIDPDIPLGTLDISFYRDDFTRIGVNPQVRPSAVGFDVEDRHIVLVDDVLHTGRTIRAALNELFDYGRPASITLAVLIERSGRELPIEAQVVGEHVETAPGEHVKLTGPDPMQLVRHKPS